MGQALYRKYRSKSFREVVGQEHITRTLSRALESGRISHAYLFTGPRGVGKTSVARVLAHVVNGLPYVDESVHLDIIEIDAASNRRIDEIRELRDKVHVSPSSAKYKIYIIDEVHMLTREAFNALLKTLEEPPPHCIFILATTEAHKLPETIISRTQRFEFRPIPKEAAAEHLARIAKTEKISIDEEAIELLAEHGQGSFRDSISLLDQLGSSGEKITEASVRDFLGLPSDRLIENIAAAVESGESPKVVSALDGLREQGADPATVARSLSRLLRQKLVSGSGAEWMAGLLKQLLEVPASSRAEDALEITLLGACAMSPGEPSPRDKQPPTKTVQASIPKDRLIGGKPAEIKKTEDPKADAQPFSQDSWEVILENVKKQAASLYTALRLAEPRVEDNKLILAFQFPLHQKKINQAKHKNLVGRTVAEVTGQEMAIESIVDPALRADIAEGQPPKKPASSEQLQTISNIFGQAEVLES